MPRDDVMKALADILERLMALATGHTTVLVAIDGCGGAGKTELARRLSLALKELDLQVSVVHFDDFYLPTRLRTAKSDAESPEASNFDWRRLRDQVLIPLRARGNARYERYDWTNDALTEQLCVAACGIIIIEGVTSSRRELRSFYNLKIWVDCPRELRLRRGIERDGEQNRARWEQEWMPAEDRYVALHRPQQNADIVVHGNEFCDIL